MAKIIGLDKLMSKLNSLPARIDVAVNKGLETGLSSTTNIAKDYCPVLSGNLRDSIGYQVNGTTGTISTNVSYAIDKEIGTVDMRAEPFMYPASQEGKKIIMADIRKNIRKELSK